MLQNFYDYITWLLPSPPWRNSLRVTWDAVFWAQSPKRSEVKVTQWCPTLCDPMDCSLPHSSIHGIFQARVLEWVAISFSRGSSWPRDRTQVSRIVDRRFTIWAAIEVLKIPPNKMWSVCHSVVLYSLWPHGQRWSLLLTVNWFFYFNHIFKKKKKLSWQHLDKCLWITEDCSLAGKGDGNPLLPGKPHGQRSLVGCSPRGR